MKRGIAIIRHLLGIDRIEEEATTIRRFHLLFAWELTPIGQGPFLWRPMPVHHYDPQHSAYAETACGERLPLRYLPRSTSCCGMITHQAYAATPTAAASSRPLRWSAHPEEITCEECRSRMVTMPPDRSLVACHPEAA